MRCLALTLFFVAVCVGLRAAGQESSPEASQPGEPSAATGDEAVHEELRALRRGLVKAVNETDIDALLSYLHPNVVVVWQNAEISRGHEGVRAYYQRALGGPDAILDSYTVEPEVEELTILYGGDTGITYGTTVSHFTFKNGRTFDLTGPWSATLEKVDGRWLIVSFHASAGLFDNPLLLAAQRALLWGCLVSGVLALVIGLLVSFFWTRARYSARTKTADA